MYQRLRQLALQPRPARPGETHAGSVRVLLMDTHVTGATASVMAAADGSASIYLSNGGGFIGGGRRHEAIRSAALEAVKLAAELKPHFKESFLIPLPPPGSVFFHAAHAVGLSLASAEESALHSQISPLLPLLDRDAAHPDALSHPTAWEHRSAPAVTLRIHPGPSSRSLQVKS